MPPGGSGAWTRCGSPDTSWAAVFCGQNGVRGHGIGPRAVGLAVSWSEARGGGNGATLGRGSPGESGRGPGGMGSVMGGRAPALHWGGGGQGHLHRGRPWGTAHPQTPQWPPSPGLRPAKASPALGVCLQCRPEPPQSVALGPGHGEQGLGRRPLGEGRHGRGVQAGQGQQAEALEQAGEQQEQRGPGQALARAHAAACHGNPGWGGAGLAREWGGAGVGRGHLWRGPREPGLELLAPGTQL